MYRNIDCRQAVLRTSAMQRGAVRRDAVQYGAVPIWAGHNELYRLSISQSHLDSSWCFCRALKTWLRTSRLDRSLSIVACSQVCRERRSQAGQLYPWVYVRTYVCMLMLFLRVTGSVVD